MNNLEVARLWSAATLGGSICCLCAMLAPLVGVFSVIVFALIALVCVLTADDDKEE